MDCQPSIAHCRDKIAGIKASNASSLELARNKMSSRDSKGKRISKSKERSRHKKAQKVSPKRNWTVEEDELLIRIMQ